MNINLCVNCMEQKESNICPHCGFDDTAAQQIPMALRWNTILHGRYLIGKVLGVGGFAITYIGYDLVLQVKVAIKEYFPSRIASRNAQNSGKVFWGTSDEAEEWKQGSRHFLEEAQKMAKIDSLPTIARVRDTFSDNGTAYIIMEYVQGVTLKEKLKNSGTITMKECVRIFAPLMEALEKVHALGMIHRDISPDNIMLRPDGRVVLLDFGAAKDFSVKSKGTNLLVSKAGFSPAEQYTQKGKIGPWTDVYALCATMYYCVYGKAPPMAMDRMERDELVIRPDEGKRVTENVRNIMAQGLAVNAWDRIRTVRELRERLQNEFREEPKPEPVKKSKKVLLVVMIVLAVLGVCFIALIVWAFSNMDEDTAQEPATAAESDTKTEPDMETNSEIEYFTEYPGQLPKPDSCVDGCTYEGESLNTEGVIYELSSDIDKAEDMFTSYLQVLEDFGCELVEYEDIEALRVFESEYVFYANLSTYESDIRVEGESCARIGIILSNDTYYCYLIFHQDDDAFYEGEPEFLADIDDDLVDPAMYLYDIYKDMGLSPNGTPYMYRIKADSEEEIQDIHTLYELIIGQYGYQLTENGDIYDIQKDSRTVGYIAYEEDLVMMGANLEADMLYLSSLLEEDEPQAESEYILPTDTEFITNEDLDALSKEEVNLALNEIYARHGYVFRTEEYQEYFSSKSWYTPDPDYDASDDSELTAIEKVNRDLIVAYEVDKGWREQ